MQDEVSECVVALCINGGKISERILKESIRETLAEMDRRDRQREDQKQRKRDAAQRMKAEKRQKKERAKYRGKQSMKKLRQQGCSLSSIEVTDGNIRSFEKCARRYRVDYCLKKDRGASPPRYYVFFKAGDVDAMTAAFKEYAGSRMENGERESVQEKLEQAREKAAYKQPEKTEHRQPGEAEHGQSGKMEPTRPGKTKHRQQEQCL